MNNNISIPQNIENQTSYKIKVSLSELFRSLVLAARSAIFRKIATGSNCGQLLCRMFIRPYADGIKNGNE